MSDRIYRFCLILTLVFMPSAQSARAVNTAALSTETILGSAALDADARLVDLRVDRGLNVITLDDRDLIEDDSPASGRSPDWKGITPWRGQRSIEEMRPGVVIRKVLNVPDARSRLTRLVFLATETPRNTVPLQISVNGARFSQPGHRVPKREYYGDSTYRFYYITLPGGLIQPGENDIRMWVDDQTSGPAGWRFLISLDEVYPIGTGDPKAHHPNRSFKSSDGGRTWSDSKLGALDSADGEYGIRLAFERYIKSGQMESAVVDAVGGADPFKKLVTDVRLTGDVAADVPPDTELKIEARSGDSPDPEDINWGEWQPVSAKGAFAIDAPGRYVQFRAAFATQNPLVSPELHSIRLKASWQQPDSVNRGTGLVVKAVHNGRVLRSSIPFEYEDLSLPELKRFRERFKLDDVVAGANGEFDAMLRLLNWSYRVPVNEDGGVMKWDPFDIAILNCDAQGRPQLHAKWKGRRRDAMCLVSNLALMFAFESMGYQARHVNEHGIGMGGHEPVEVWSNEYNKWVMMDATRDYYYFDPDTGLPLDLMEIHKRLAAALPGADRLDRPFAHEVANEVAGRVRIGWREGANPVSITTDALHLLPMIGTLRYIPRNNFISKPYPLPPAQGYTEWGWNGYANFFDPQFPRRPEYMHYSDRAVDYHEPLNQAELTVNETKKAGVLKVAARTMTPGLDSYLLRVDDGEWAQRSGREWDWDLHAGLNRIEVRVRTKLGVLGPISCLQATYNP